MKSKYQNVYWMAEISKWVAKVKVNYISKHLGCFPSEEEAHAAAIKFKLENKIIAIGAHEPPVSDAFEYSNGHLLAKFKTQNYSIGDVVGSACKTHGYVIVGHGKHLHQAHRLVWEMFNGPVPDGLYIDHINGIRSDNRIENLRVVDKATNAKNRRLQHNNKTGIQGVKSCQGEKFEVAISSEGRRIYLGKFKDFFEACCVRKSAEVKHNYHQNHGRTAS
jgi:hypothetical protein